MSVPGQELWLVRHGQTTRNRDGALAGWDDVELTADGEAQARALAPRLREVSFDQVWSSDLTRAVRTAQLAYGDPSRDRRLREIDFGSLEGQLWQTLDAEYKEALLRFEGFEAPGGESIVQLQERVESFLATLPPGRHLLFTHGGVIRLLCHRLGQAEFVQPGTITVIDWSTRTLLRRSA
ncbi:MAG: histidine phosphatase family protein [Myxococcales bacterium]|nr:histidine phosphatase family protein [Myxococcales bacterium]